MSFDQKEMFNLMYKLARLTVPDTRVEQDSMGPVNVPLDRMFGSETMRLLLSSSVGGLEERMPRPIIMALGIVKKACAAINKEYGQDSKTCDAICKAADEVISGKLYDEHHFPLAIWQSGSGSHTNMNVNEVISNRAIKILGGQLGTKDPVHPYNDVNKSLGSNDSFSSAINIAVAMQLQEKLYPSLKGLMECLVRKEKLWAEIIKVGRTHLMDAVPLTLGQEFSGYKQMITNNFNRLESSMQRLYQLCIGGTADGTDLTCHEEFGPECVKEIARITGLPFITAPNFLEAIASRDVLVEVHGELNSIAVSTMKIANDIRFLTSGPRAGLAELSLPLNDSSCPTMPGKVNPTECEMMTMICAQVMGNHVAVTVGGLNGHFELNAFMPLIASNVLRSINLLSDGLKVFTNKCVDVIKPNTTNIKKTMKQSLMLATALLPHIGYDRAATIAKAAHYKGTTLKQEALNAGISEADFEAWVRPANMLGPTYIFFKTV